MPTWSALYFQNRRSPVIEQLIFFHDHTIVVIIIVIVLVGYLLGNAWFIMNYNLKIYGGHELERIWTILPALFLLLIAFPSLRILYLIEEIEDPELRIKVIGHQWYWSYEYRDLRDKLFDSYILSEIIKPLFRLLNVDSVLVLPINTKIRIIVSRVDVIHSWTIPAEGIKVDAIPGRLNQIYLYFNRIGLFTGQCSEICGSNHRFIPIIIRVIPRLDFLIKIF